MDAMTSFSSESVNRIVKALTEIIADQGAEIEQLRSRLVDHGCGIADRQVSKLLNFLDDQEVRGHERVDISEVTNIFVTDPADD